MSRTIELPDEAFRAIERYVAQRGETPEAVIIAFAQSVVVRVSASVVEDISGYVYDPADDPLAEFLGTVELTQPDAVRRHDEVFGSEGIDAEHE